LEKLTWKNVANFYLANIGIVNINDIDKLKKSLANLLNISEIEAMKYLSDLYNRELI